MTEETVSSMMTDIDDDLPRFRTKKQVKCFPNSVPNPVPFMSRKKIKYTDLKFSGIPLLYLVFWDSVFWH